jgi:hypothetical protein
MGEVSSSAFILPDLSYGAAAQLLLGKHEWSVNAA